MFKGDACVRFLQGANARRERAWMAPAKCDTARNAKQRYKPWLHSDKKENSRRKEIRGFLEKIVVDAGIGHMSQLPNFEEKALVQVMKDLAGMTGQKPPVPAREEIHRGFQDPGKPDRGRPRDAP